MCKILVIPGVKPDKQKAVEKFIMGMTAPMTQTPDNDGFGYAEIYSNGSIAGEKWLKPDDAWKKRLTTPSKPKKRLMDMFGDALEDLNSASENSYHEFGKRPKGEVPVAYIVHSRNKTQGEININNTHPFYEFELEGAPKTALIHNGTIKNHEKLATKKYSTCDSEVILHEWLKLKMYDDIGGMPELAKTLIGEYAVGILTTAKDANGTEYPALDLFKSNKDLYCAFIKELDTYVFCTSKYTLETGAKNAEMTISELFEFKNGFYFRIDAESGEVMEWIEFDLSEKIEPFNNNSTNWRTHHRPASENVTQNYITGRTNVNEQIKKQFENNHRELFLEYYEVEELSAKDKELLKTLEQNTDPEAVKALNLVKLCLAQ